MPIAPIAGYITPPTDATAPAGERSKTGTAPDTSGFGDSLNRLIGAVESTGQEANAAVTRMLDGTGEVHDAMIALQQAELTFQLTTQVRNKLVQAYHEIMRMPV